MTTITIELEDGTSTVSNPIPPKHLLVVPAGTRITLKGGGEIIGPVTIDANDGADVRVYGVARDWKGLQ